MFERYRIIPGSRPPSAAPKRALTATNPAKFWMNPKHMAITPQAKVKTESHMRGVIFFKTRLLGTSLCAKSQPFNTSYRKCCF
jgi:hypothetical protein